MSGYDDTGGSRNYQQPLGSKHTIPTVQEYRSDKQDQRDYLEAQRDDGPGGFQGFKDRVESHLPGHHDESSSGTRQNGQWQGGANSSQSHQNSQQQGSNNVAGHDEVTTLNKRGDTDQDYRGMKDTSQVSAASNAKAKRKEMKHRKPERAEREVTDPITHLPVTIQDFTDADLEHLENGDDFTIRNKGTHGVSGSERDSVQEATARGNEIHQNMMKVFPPPDFELAQQELAMVHMHMYTIGLSAVAIVTMAIASLWFRVLEPHPWNQGPLLRLISALFVTALGAALIGGTIYTAQDVGQKKTKEIWDDSVWEAERDAAEIAAKRQDPESVQWLNMLLGSIWPLVNPDLFTSLADMLEDVMQASLPKLVRMVSVEDIGQGSEPVRILGVKWLPRSGSKKSVSASGKFEKSPDEKGCAAAVYGATDQTGQQDASADGNNRPIQSQEGSEKQPQNASIAPGMEAEEGEFFNLEIAFAYKTSRARRQLRDRAKNMHIYLAFYLPGNIKLPVWVELRGLVGTLRVRMQTSPDPPFVGLCTMTLLGQPKVELSCVPLVKQGLNLMDVPLISNFVQSAVDAAMSEYVAPKSQTFDLKAMLAGEDFKTETTARGALLIVIKRAYDFKHGDSGIPLISKGSSDSYVSIGWAKFGKPVWSTRVIVSEMHPYWEEQMYMLVGPEELDAGESLRVQLWDSDRVTADDDLGRIELDLKQLMKGHETNGKMQDRVDAFQALGDGAMPGRLEWSVGYFTKARLSDYQVQKWAKEPRLTTVDQLKRQVYADAADKLSETARDETSEIEQQQVQDFHEKCEEIINGSVPLDDYPCGILSVQIHQITNLEIRELRKDRTENAGQENEEDEEGGALPSSYCTVILNHGRIYKTRTKPKNSQPFFNAATERIVRDWRTASVMISVQDARVHEDDTLLGVVYLPIASIFRQRKCSRFNGYYPLAGGMGCGRMRVSVVYRSLQVQPERNMLGWDYGTLEVAPEVQCTDSLDDSLQNHRLKFTTRLSKGKMQARKTDGTYGDWSTRDGKSLRLAVRARYAMPLVVEFRTSSTLLRDKTPAFAILWLCNIPDEEEQTLSLPIYDGDLKRAIANQLPEAEMGKKLGELKLKVTFRRGLSRAHERLASQDQHVNEVMEILHTIHDTLSTGDTTAFENWQSGDDIDNGSSDDSDDDYYGKHNAHGGGRFSHDGMAGGSLGSSSEMQVHQRRGSTASKRHSGSSFIDDIKNYRRNKDQLHRRGRGAMQWKIPRTMAWMKHKTEHAAEKVKDSFSHSEREPDVDTEV